MKCLIEILKQPKLVLKNPANSCRTKMNTKCVKIYMNLPNHLFRDMYCYNIMVRIVGTVNLSSDIERHQFFVDIDVVDQIA